MKAWVLHGAMDIRLQDVLVPEPGPGEVLVAMRTAGVCGSDLHYHAHGRIGNFVPTRPFTLGHEFAGDVVATGPGAVDSDLARVGSRVAVDPSHACGSCRECRSGRYNLCPHMVYYGSAAVRPPRDGCYADFIVARARNCHTLPDSMDYALGAILEPLSVAAHAVNRSGGVAGRSVLVTGGGTIGQLVVLCARAFGASRIVVSDPRPYARSSALESGADHALDPTEAGFADTLADIVPGGFEIVLESSGTTAGVDTAIRAAARGATVVQVGTLNDGTSLPVNALLTREIDYVGSWRFANVFGRVLDLIENGRIDPRPLISRTFPFERLPDALADARAGVDVIKVQITR